MDTGFKPMNSQYFPYLKNQRKYCILIGLELYPFTSKVYPFGAFTGTEYFEQMNRNDICLNIKSKPRTCLLNIGNSWRAFQSCRCV